ncbi:MAG TPA: hypothetical protein PKN50_09355, partial [Spirochaetota bacterium]|nr:hypothetical protein [Spirochaetota bacterium]HPV43620.1 hypothetical protein [Spirochaetota bacterium]
SVELLSGDKIGVMQQVYYLGFSSSSDPAEGTQWRLCEAKRHPSKGNVLDRGFKILLSGIIISCRLVQSVTIGII